MSSQEESDAMLEAKLATMIEPYKKVGINTDDCTVKGLPICLIPVEQFGKIQKFLHHLVRQEIFPQLMARAFLKGIISSAGSLTAADIWNINTWLRTKEGQTSIQEEFNIRKLKREAAKQLHNGMSSSGNEMERMVDEKFGKMGRMVDEQFRKMGERADTQDKVLADLRKMLQSKEMSYSGKEMERMVDEQFRKMGERADAQDKALADLRKMLQSIDSRLMQQSQEIQDIGGRLY